MQPHEHPTAASRAAANDYTRHRPEQTVLYAALQENWKTFVAELEAVSEPSVLPAFVVAEVEAFLRCGILSHGMVLAKCKDCAVTVIQRFNSALAANPHFHTLFLDGVYTFPLGRAPVFRERVSASRDLALHARRFLPGLWQILHALEQARAAQALAVRCPSAIELDVELRGVPRPPLQDAGHLVLHFHLRWMSILRCSPVQMDYQGSTARTGQKSNS